MHINKQNFKKLLKDNISFITIDGITCSGKTSFAKILKKELNKYFPNILILSKDLFLYPRKKRINITKKLKNIKSKNQNFLHYDDKKLKTSEVDPFTGPSIETSNKSFAFTSIGIASMTSLRI